MSDTVIIGAGPGGLGVAGELARMGVPALVLDRAPHLAATWRAAYDRVRLNTVRWLSHLPGERIPTRPAAGRREATTSRTWSAMRGSASWTCAWACTWSGSSATGRAGG